MYFIGSILMQTYQFNIVVSSKSDSNKLKSLKVAKWRKDERRMMNDEG